MKHGNMVFGAVLGAIAAGLIAGGGVASAASVASAEHEAKPGRTSSVERAKRVPGSARSARWYPDCERGEFCLWSGELFWGESHRVGLDTANPGECILLPEGFEARSFINRTDRPVTVYQGEHCSTEGDFATYPGGGTYVPAAPYLVRGVQVWER